MLPSIQSLVLAVKLMRGLESIYLEFRELVEEILDETRASKALRQEAAETLETVRDLVVCLENRVQDLESDN